MTHQQETALENIVGKEKIARNEQFLLFPQFFLLLNQIVVPHLFTFLTSYFCLLLKCKSLKLAYEVKGYRLLPGTITIIIAFAATVDQHQTVVNVQSDH